MTNRTVHVTPISSDNPGAVELRADRGVVVSALISHYCPDCGERIDERLGVVHEMAAGRSITGEHQRMHFCSSWPAVAEERVWLDDHDDDDEAIAAATVRVLAEVDAAVAEIDERRSGKLARELAAVVADYTRRVADGEDLDDVVDDLTTGSEVHPGIYRDGEQWVAWDWSAADDGSTVEASR